MGLLVLRPDTIFTHRRRINTEKKAKVVAAARGAELNQFFAELAIFPWGILKIRTNCIRMNWRKVWIHLLQIALGKKYVARVARNWLYCVTSSSVDLYHFYVFILPLHMSTVHQLPHSFIWRLKGYFYVFSDSANKYLIEIAELVFGFLFTQILGDPGDAMFIKGNPESHRINCAIL